MPRSQPVFDPSAHCLNGTVYSALLNDPQQVRALGVADALSLSQAIDGQIVWQGQTGGRARNAAQLISDSTDVMTLQPGDVVNVNEGDGVVCEIDGIGLLVNHTVGDAAFAP